MPRKTTDHTTPKKKTARALPPALVENARAARGLAMERLRSRGLAAIDRIRSKLGDLAENALDVGEQLRELAVADMPAALGYSGFDEICRLGVGIAPSTARRWMALATNLRRDFVLRVGLDRARALMELSDASPGDEVPEDLVDATVTLPSGATLELSSASVEAIDAAAKELRQNGRPETRRGFTTTAAERKAHAAIAKRLRQAPVEAHAKSRLVATRDADGGKLILEVRIRHWDATLKALRAK